MTPKKGSSVSAKKSPMKDRKKDTGSKKESASSRNKDSKKGNDSARKKDSTASGRKKKDSDSARKKDSGASGRKKESSAGAKKGKSESHVPISTTHGEHVNMDIWHGLLPNEDTATLLCDDGNFLMRGIEKGKTFNIVLSVRWGKDVLNAAIVEDKKKGGYEFQGNNFETIKDIIDFYQVRKRPIFICGISTTLETPIRRKHWELRHNMIRLGKELGAGSYGTVYKGTLKFDENKKPLSVAIKVLLPTPEASGSVWKEARNHQMLDHPNVVKLYGIANDYLPYYLVMEFVPGGSVDRYLEKKGAKLTVAARVQILIEAASGLAYLHSNGLIHRDIACRNLLIDKVVKIADFGMSRKTESYKVDPNKPMNLRWLAPEVYETAIVTKSTDVYAFGIVIFEVFTVPYAIPYENWKPNKVYDEVVNKGYRLEAPKLMPKLIIQDLFDDCLADEADRPTFETILARLLSYPKDNKGRGLF
jgi:hypothetical protein